MTEQVREEKRLSRPVARRWRGVAIAGVAAVTGALALAALQRSAASGSRFAVVEHEAGPVAGAPDPLMADLIRCRALPPQVDEPACRAAWEENRRRFFGESRAMRVPGDPLPTYAPIPAPQSASAEKER